jgi:ubiquinone/menaquinone biosynthesis C-methylase UbiE
MISVPPNTRIERLPEGDKYVGFIFASGVSPELVERALREAHSKLEFQVNTARPAGIPTRQSKCASDNKQLITMQFDAVADGCRHATRMMEGTGRAPELYDPDALGDIPARSTSSALGCGDPAAAANYKPGETVVDLGSGGGIDCILAARAVGATGRVVGVDLSANMIALARRSRSQLGLSNLEFFQGEAEHLPMQDASADVVISNNTINLVADKDALFAEMYRVLKPGGRFVLCDVTIDSALPNQVRSQVFARAGCINGALEQRDMQEKLLRAGFANVRLDQIQPLNEENFAGLSCVRALGVKAKRPAKDLTGRLAAPRHATV